MNDNIPLINTVGEFNITIKNPHWTQLEPKDGDDMRIALVLPCYTDPNDQYPDGQRLDFHMYFTRQLVTGGQNKGKPLFEISQDQCLKLGMTAPFMPSKIKELDGVKSTLVTEEDEYKGKKSIKAKWLNNTKKKPMAIKDVNDIWSKMVKSAAPVNSVPVTASETNDDMPY